MITSQRINIFLNNNESSMSIAYNLENKLKERGYIVHFDYHDQAILNICIGGDGAFLRAVHQSNFSIIPFVGINTGHLGFYQEILVPHIDEFIKRYMAGDYHIEPLRLLDATVILDRDIFEHKALNEVVIKTSDHSIIKLDVLIEDHHLETFAGDALLISTPSGSTAYNFSAGGSILYQSLDGYQMTPLAPINSKAYRSLQNSIVLPSTAKLKIKLNQQSKSKNILICDGILHHYHTFDQIIVGPSSSYINKLVFDKNWYWENIKDKFL